MDDRLQLPFPFILHLNGNTANTIAKKTKHDIRLPKLKTVER